MLETLRTVLQRAEVSEECRFSRDDFRAWTADEFAGLLASGVLVEAGRSGEIDYSGCEQSCRIDGEFITHPASGETVCLHLCRYGCGLVQLPASEFDQWTFSLTGLGCLIAKLIGSTGEIVEDIRDRVVSIGFRGNADSAIELFVARGLRWPDAATILNDARRLKAADHPFVLSLAASPEPTIWPTMKPAHAVLAEHIGAGRQNTELSLQLEPLLSLDSIPHPSANSPAWIRHKAAATTLRKVTDGMSINHSEKEISEACRRGVFRTNGQIGHNLRINLDSFNTWLWSEHDKNLAEDRDETGVVVKRRRRRQTSKARR